MYSNIEKTLLYLIIVNTIIEQSDAQRSLVGYSPWGHQRVGHNLATEPQHMLKCGCLKTGCANFKSYVSLVHVVLLLLLSFLGAKSPKMDNALLYHQE